MGNEIMTQDMENLMNSGRIQGEFALNSKGIHAEFSEAPRLTRGQAPCAFLFPRWEQNIPTLGTKHSHAGNKTGFLQPVVGVWCRNRLAANELTSRASRDYGSLVTRLRLVVTLLLMLVVGVNTAWGQAVTEGLYYIASRDYNANNTTTNFYLCPTEPNNDWPWYYTSTSPYYTNTNTGMPFMTTYPCRNGVYDSKKALWVVKESSTTGYVQIIHLIDGKYLTYNVAIGDGSNEGRMRLHLDGSPGNDGYALFRIEYVSSTTTYDIISKYAEDNNTYPSDNKARKYLNYTGPKSGNGNIESLVATNARADGPKVNNKQINTGGIVGLWNAGSSADNNSKWYPESILLTAPAISYEGATKTITITDNNNLPNCTIRYTIGDGSQEAPTATTGEEYDPLNPLVINNETNIKAAVFAFDVRLSDISNAMLNQTITLSDESLEYNGLEREPSVTIKYGDNTIPADEYLVEYSNNVNAGTAIATITDKPGGNYYVMGGFLEFEITKVPLTVTADNQNISYGSAVPTYTLSYSGFVNGETADNLTTAPTITCSYTANGNVGTYDIVPSGGASTNYSFTYVDGTLTVGQLEAVLSWGNTTLIYNETAQTPTVTVSNLVEGDVCTVTLTISGDNVTVIEGVNTAVEKGSYTATATALSNTNYKLPTNEADSRCDFTIVSAIVFTISIEGWTYGSDPNNPVPTGNDDRTVTYAYKVKDADDATYSETVPSRAGNYTVKGTIAAEGEYAASEATADFTIEPKSLSTGTAPNTVSADGITIAIARNDEGVYTITLKDGETELVAGTSGTEYDYSKSIDDTDSSFGIVTVAGANNYKGGFSTQYAKVTFAKPDQQGNGFVEAGVFEAPDGTGDLATPEGLKAYIVTGINNVNNTVTIEEISYIPEGVPVLLLSNGEVNNGFMVKLRNGGTDITDAQKASNKLKKASGDETARHKDAATIYLLYRGEFVLNIAGVLKDGKIYLDPGGVSSGAPLRIVVDGTTGMEGVISKMEEVKELYWYTLDGRRLNGKPAKKGLYLKEGRKVVIK